MGKTIGLFGGGFKPPTTGHFNVAKKALEDLKDLDELIIFVGSGIRDGITQPESIKVWEIYKKYLDSKVKIMPAKSPIGDIIRYGKNNPDDTIYFVIGAREQVEADFKDFASRTKGIEEKYPNMKIKLITTSDTISGTKARLALQDSYKDFTQYLPDELSEKDKEEVFNALTSSLTEISQDFFSEEIQHWINEDIKDYGNVSEYKIDLNDVYEYSTNNNLWEFYDEVNQVKIIAKLKPTSQGVFEFKFYSLQDDKQLSFSRLNHYNPKVMNTIFKIFIDGVLPNTNKILIQPNDSTRYRLFKALINKNVSPQNYNIKVKDTIESPAIYVEKKTLNENIQTNLDRILFYQDYFINVSPSTFNVDIVEENIVISDINKPYPQGFDDVTDTKQVPVDLNLEENQPEDGKAAPYGSGYNTLNENASYSKDIDIQDKINQLTQHMINKGYNIEPLPKVEFVNGDVENAREFLGKTAYYNPNIQTIVLYTEGRHPKDIVRSYAHEMIHHIQNLEGRLGNITTTNTQEDDHLNDIEAEANLKGTMTFRNWTDSLNEANKPYKDILPQEKFAQETGQDWVEKALKILPRKQDYNTSDYEVKILPLDKVKPTQFGEDYINASSEYEAEQYKEYIKGEISAQDLRKEDFYPIVVDRDTMEILDGNHRHAVHTMLGIPKIKAILVSKKLNESNKPYKHKHGFNDKLGKDPFGLNQYARELAQGLEEAIVGDKIECDNCGWSWDIKDGGDDLYLCHKCWHDNTPST